MSPPRKYSPEMIAAVKKLRSQVRGWKSMARELGLSASGMRNAMLYRDGSNGGYTPDKMPAQLRPWPENVNFSPDELELRT